VQSYRSCFLRLILSSLILSSVSFLAAASAAEAQHSPPVDQIVAELTQGNQRFIAGHPRHPHCGPDDVRKNAREGQHPQVAVLACADSRVPPEILFDKGIGDLFSIRVAGNVANEDEIASIEYAVAHLHVPLILVLGHTQCGAVTAVVEDEELDDNLKHLTAHIREAVHATQKSHPELRGAGLVAAAVEVNVRESIAGMLRNSELIRQQAEAGKVKVEGAIYDLESGKVRWMKAPGR